MQGDPECIYLARHAKLKVAEGEFPAGVSCSDSLAKLLLPVCGVDYYNGSVGESSTIRLLQ